MWEALTFDRLITGPVIHLVYWAGLGVVVIAAFSVVGAAIGVALREGSWAAMLAAVPVLVVGLLVVGAAGLIWRAMCEFYVAVFRIGDDLAALRRAAELESLSTWRADGRSEAGARNVETPSAPLPDAPGSVCTLADGKLACARREAGAPRPLPAPPSRQRRRGRRQGRAMSPASAAPLRRTR